MRIQPIPTRYFPRCPRPMQHLYIVSVVPLQTNLQAGLDELHARLQRLQVRGAIVPQSPSWGNVRDARIAEAVWSCWRGPALYVWPSLVPQPNL
ncbi:uncharacterized protein B0I36DRAFT_314247 [Microdochium trichocladiopsis]|uniref:Uncharacterized protein n=1 Tax=Microdochium trichocladiopsis TaxID=1682393 RepID=A0A9P9BUD8_9PEZI|nr:uncharacterized protein B0I36DRAFT_314247 [Microdochium trichocladiopsis]KAH7037526.1 hypothetical protein B0I36DRAFT_314247 [Microdochium trichocladiopsis]